MVKALVISTEDNVATALYPLAKGEKVEVKLGEENLFITLREEIPIFHKFSLKAMKCGEKVIKYGEVVGEVSAPILEGQWVHIHNIRSGRGGGDV